jgi:hypothetical protein
MLSLGVLSEARRVGEYLLRFRGADCCDEKHGWMLHPRCPVESSLLLGMKTEWIRSFMVNHTNGMKNDNERVFTLYDEETLDCGVPNPARESRVLDS